MEPLIYGRATVSDAYLSFLENNVRPEDRAALRAWMEGPSTYGEAIAEARRVQAEQNACIARGLAAAAEHEERKRHEREEEEAVGSRLRMTLLKAHALVRQLQALRGGD